jgi:cell wall-associated NlpC family hydrolase
MIKLFPNNDYPILEIGEFDERQINGGCSVISNQPTTAEAELCDGRLLVTGVSAGSVSVIVTSSVGLALPYGYQICDSSRIEAYTLKNGGQLYLTGINASVTSPFVAEPYSARDTVYWQSTDENIATVSKEGTITAVGIGYADIYGTFFDKWNIDREICIHVVVGEPLSVNNLGDDRAHKEVSRESRIDRQDLSPHDDTVFTGERGLNNEHVSCARLCAPMSTETFDVLLSEAGKHLGKPYVRGAKGPDKFDCSGFVCWVLAHSGIYQIQAHALGVYRACVPVAREDARPGDLVFFTETFDTWKKITHVGFYMGDNLMLHAGQPVQYTYIDTPYWNKHFYGFGRLSS